MDQNIERPTLIFFRRWAKRLITGLSVAGVVGAVLPAFGTVNVSVSHQKRVLDARVMAARAAIQAADPGNAPPGVHKPARVAQWFNWPNWNNWNNWVNWGNWGNWFNR
jgi:hypothetical protein